MFERFIQEDIIENKTEYQVPYKQRIKKEKQAYEEAEREDREDDVLFGAGRF